MQCTKCSRELDTEKELEVHIKYFHKSQASGVCPDCGGTLMRQEGCEMCHCGYSKCG